MLFVMEGREGKREREIETETFTWLYNLCFENFP